MHHFRSLLPALYFGHNTVKNRILTFAHSFSPLNSWLRPLRGKRQPPTLADPDDTPFWSLWPMVYSGGKRSLNGVIRNLCVSVSLAISNIDMKKSLKCRFRGIRLAPSNYPIVMKLNTLLPWTPPRVCVQNLKSVSCIVCCPWTLKNWIIQKSVTYICIYGRVKRINGMWILHIFLCLFYCAKFFVKIWP